ncbi:MAG: hypothetical protein ABI277_14025 [Burkholderiaceae bacterium]
MAKLDIVRQALLMEYRQCIFDDVVDGESKTRLIADARELDELARDVQQPLDVDRDVIETLAKQRLVDVLFRIQDLHDRMQRRQRVRHLVTDAGHHEAQRRESRVLDVHGLHLTDFGLIDDRHEATPCRSTDVQVLVDLHAGLIRPDAVRLLISPQWSVAAQDREVMRSPLTQRRAGLFSGPKPSRWAFVARAQHGACLIEHEHGPR